MMKGKILLLAIVLFAGVKSADEPSHKDRQSKMNRDGIWSGCPDRCLSCSHDGFRVKCGSGCFDRLAIQNGNGDYKCVSADSPIENCIRPYKLDYDFDSTCKKCKTGFALVGSLTSSTRCRATSGNSDDKVDANAILNTYDAASPKDYFDEKIVTTNDPDDSQVFFLVAGRCKFSYSTGTVDISGIGNVANCKQNADLSAKLKKITNCTKYTGSTGSYSFETGKTGTGGICNECDPGYILKTITTYEKGTPNLVYPTQECVKITGDQVACSGYTIDYNGNCDSGCNSALGFWTTNAIFEKGASRGCTNGSLTVGLAKFKLITSSLAVLGFFYFFK